MTLRTILFFGKKNAAMRESSVMIPSKYSLPNEAGLNYTRENDGKGHIGESVTQEGSPLWLMDSYVELYNPVEGLDPFIRRVLMKRTPKTRPIRGPDTMKLKNFMYRCAIEGDLDKFSGTESVFSLDGEEFYRMVFSGGLSDVA